MTGYVKQLLANKLKKQNKNKQYVNLTPSNQNNKIYTTEVK